MIRDDGTGADTGKTTRESCWSVMVAHGFAPIASWKVEVDVGPVRFVKLIGRIAHADERAITNPRFAFEVTMAGVQVYHGDAHRWMAIGHPSIINGVDGMQIEIHVPLYRGVLAAIEQSRRGGDLQIDIGGMASYGIAHQIPGQGHWQVGETRWSNLAHGDSVRWKWTIPRSQWLELLKELNWQATELVEIPLELTGNTRAHRALEAATEAHAMGNHAEALMRCYNALEGMTPDQSIPESVISHLSEPGQEAVDRLVRAAKKLAHEGRHDDRNPENVGQREATTMLLVTSGLLHYLQGLGD